MKYIFLLLLIALVSCSDAFIKHELTYTKAGACSGMQPNIGMLSNTNGERYEFEACLDDDFSGTSYKVDRKGDSILVNFPKTAGKNQSLYKLTLNIDAKPAYHFIVIDGREVKVVPYY